MKTDLQHSRRSQPTAHHEVCRLFVGGPKPQYQSAKSYNCAIKAEFLCFTIDLRERRRVGWGCCVWLARLREPIKGYTAPPKHKRWLYYHKPVINIKPKTLNSQSIRVGNCGGRLDWSCHQSKAQNVEKNVNIGTFWILTSLFVFTTCHQCLSCSSTKFQCN